MAIRPEHITVRDRTDDHLQDLTAAVELCYEVRLLVSLVSRIAGSRENHDEL